MPELPSRTTLLVEIEQRQDELLRQLDELEKKIAGVLAQYAASCQPKQGSEGTLEATNNGHAPLALPLAAPQSAPRAA